MPFTTVIVMAALAEATLGATVGKLFDGMLKPLLAGIERKRVEDAVSAALKRAAESFARRHPNLAITQANETFIERIVGTAMLKLLAPGEAPDARAIAASYHTLNPHVTVEETTPAFEWLFHEISTEFEKEPALAELVHRQKAAATFRNTEEMLPFMGMLPTIAEDLKRMLLGSAIPVASLPRIRELFGRKSSELLEWPQTLNTGDWLERPELQRLHELLTDEATQLVLLLGTAGCGKSALMARLAGELQASGVICLALKADALPRGIGTLPELQAHLELAEPLAACLGRLADEGPVVLLIDQLDALCDLMVMRHTERLSVLLSIIHEAYSLRNPNLRVVVSTRTFEAKHDKRLRDLVDKADHQGNRGTVARIEMEEVRREAVEAILASQGVATNSWPEEFRRMLQTPQHLDIFLSFLKDSQDVSAFTAYPRMLEAVWERTIVDTEDSASRLDLVTQLASELAEEEELWVPEHAYAVTFPSALRALKSAGILRSGDGHAVLGFRHQTLFDFARSKAFLRREDSLPDYVLDRQTSLFVRPILWSALGHLRELAPKRYRHEFQRLWNSVTRLHLRYLLMEFLGQQQEPMREEQQWLLSCLEDSDRKAKALQAMHGSQGWFNVLGPEILPRLLAEQTNTVWPLSGLLIAALPFAQGKVVEFLRRFWLDHPDKDSESLWVLHKAKTWDEATVSMLETIISRTSAGAWLVQDIVGKIAEQNSERAARFLTVSLEYAFLEMERSGSSPKVAVNSLQFGQ